MRRGPPLPVPLLGAKWPEKASGHLDSPSELGGRGDNPPNGEINLQKGSGDQLPSLLFLAAAPPGWDGGGMQLLRPPARGGINAGGGPCVAFISSKGCRMGKSRPPTAGSDPISISPTGLGPNWDIAACLGRAAGGG